MSLQYRGLGTTYSDPTPTNGDPVPVPKPFKPKTPVSVPAEPIIGGNMRNYSSSSHLANRAFVISIYQQYLNPSTIAFIDAAVEAYADRLDKGVDRATVAAAIRNEMQQTAAPTSSSGINPVCPPGYTTDGHGCIPPQQQSPVVVTQTPEPQTQTNWLPWIAGGVIVLLLLKK